MKKPTARFASGGGLETLFSLLAVSPIARSGHNLLSRSQSSRHGRLGGNSLLGDGHHHETSLPRLSLEKKPIFHHPFTDRRSYLQLSASSHCFVPHNQG